MASDIRAEWLKRSGKAGAFAALVMIAAQFLLRLTVGSGGVPSFPEMVVAMIARLTPVSVFGWVTETLGSLGQILAAGSSGFFCLGLHQAEPQLAVILSKDKHRGINACTQESQ